MPTVNYKPELLTHPNCTGQNPRVAGFMAGDLFLPVAGIQVVDPEIWNATVNSEEFGERISEYIERGVITVAEETEHPTLSKKTPTAAVKFVKDTYDLSLLQSWREDEARPSVIKVLDERIAELTPPPSKKKEG